MWNPREPVFESVVFSEYHDMTLSLLIYPAHGPNRWSNESQEPELWIRSSRFCNNDCHRSKATCSDSFWSA